MPVTIERPPALMPSQRVAVLDTWDRLWRHAPSDAKDDALLARERRSPRFAAILRYLESTFGGVRGLRTVELGSGRGDLSALLAERGASVALLDASQAALGQARRRFERLGLPADFVRADLLVPPPETIGAFDVALSTGVIEHFRGNDRTQALQSHRALLGDGGTAIVSVPNAWCVPYRLWKLYLEARHCWPYGMEIPYSVGELRRRAEQAGLTSCAVCGLGFWQSVGDHWLRGVFHRQVDWIGHKSLLDGVSGMSLLLLARKGKGHGWDTNSADGVVERHFARRGQGCEFEMEVDWIRRHLPRSAKRVAEVGCGGGSLFAAIGPDRVIGVDYEPTGLQYTRRRFPDAPLLCASAERLSLDTASMDALILQHVIEHLGNAEKAARDWHRVLRPGGMLLIQTPNADFVDPSLFDDPTHVRLYSAEELATLLRRHGFEIVDLRTIGLPWFRRYGATPSGWRFRRLVTGRASFLSSWPMLRWRGQTLCCAARRASA